MDMSEPITPVPHNEAEQAPAPPAQPPPVSSIEDGRRRRSADSRRRILQAMLELVQEGNPDPSAEATALRAGVGLRTVFRLFRDIEGVCAEMVAPQRREFVECFATPFTAPRGPERLRELFGRLVHIYEARMPLRRAATTRRYTSPSLAAGMKELNHTIDIFIRHQFAGEGNTVPPRIVMLNLLMSYDAWMRLRDDQGLSFDETVTTLQTAINAQLS